jgi:zinc protease
MTDLPRSAHVHRPAFRRRTLANGLTVLVIADERVPAISLTLMAAGGGATDPAGRGGTATLTAGLLNKGSRHRDADTLAEAIDDLGASFAARTGRDSSTVSLAGLAEDFPSMLDLLAEIALEPVFPEDEFEILRQRRLHGLTRSLDQPAAVADWVFARGLFPDHPYGPPLAGTAATVAAIEATDPSAWHRQRFAPGNCCLAVAGAVASDKALAAVEKRFAGWQSPTPDELAFPRATAPARRILLVDRPEAPQAQIRWGHHGLARSDRRHDAAEMVNDVLGGGGFSSRLMQTIRSEKGLTYGIHSGFDARLHAGPFLVSTFTPTASVGEVLTDIDNLVGAFRDQGPTAEELDAACRRLVGGYPLQFETATQVAGQLLERELYNLPEDDLETYQDRMLAVDTAEAAHLAHELMDPARALAVVVGDVQGMGSAPADWGTVEMVDAGALFGGQTS